MIVRLIVAFAIAVPVLTACGGNLFEKLERGFVNDGPALPGGGRIIKQDPTEKLDIVPILDPNGNAKAKYGLKWNELTDGQKIDFAIQEFYKYDDEISYGKFTDRRNRLQERLFQVSALKCNVFVSALRNTRSSANFILGSLATIAGTVGGILTGATGSRILAGTAGILTGVRAEFNETLFQNLTTQVIVRAIDLRRREIYDQIVINGQSKSISDYPVEAAIKDALYYHGQCNIVIGLEVADKTIQEFEDPGLSTAGRTIARSLIIRELLDDEISVEDAKTLVRSYNDFDSGGTPRGIGLGGTTRFGVDVEHGAVDLYFRENSNAANSHSAFEKFAAKLPLAEETDRKRLVVAAKAVRDKALSGVDSCKIEIAARTEALTNALLSSVADEDRISDVIGREYKIAVARLAIKALGRQMTTITGHQRDILTRARKDFTEKTKKEHTVSSEVVDKWVSLFNESSKDVEKKFSLETCSKSAKPNKIEPE